MVRRIVIGTLLLGACSSGQDPVDVGEPASSQVVGSMEFSAETRVMESFPVQIQPVLTLKNTGSSPAEVAFPDGCVVLLQVHRTAARTGTPVWDQQNAAGCTMALVEVDLAAGESRQLQGPTVSAADILGDSIPAGTYHLSVLARPLGGERLILPAGSAALAR